MAAAGEFEQLHKPNSLIKFHFRCLSKEEEEKIRS